jgi:hypothetical protein
MLAEKHAEHGGFQRVAIRRIGKMDARIGRVCGQKQLSSKSPASNAKNQLVARRLMNFMNARANTALQLVRDRGSNNTV